MGQHHVTDTLPEWRLQAAIAAHLDKIGQPYAASLEGVRLNPFQARQAKVTGMKAGEPDLRLYFESARTVFVELKRAKGYLNADQRKRIPILRALGFVVHVVKVADEGEAVAAIDAILAAERAGGSGWMESASIEK